jgi:hypothetical protein
MNLPKQVRDKIVDLLWSEADRLNWSNLSAQDKARLYSQWTESSEIGGQLGAYMDPCKVRVYLKDTILKSYTRVRLSGPGQVYRVLDVDPDVVSVEEYIKPHGRRLPDGRVIAWSKASDWKPTLMTVFERAAVDPRYGPFAVILLQIVQQVSKYCLTRSGGGRGEAIGTRPSGLARLISRPASSRPTCTIPR